MEEERDIRRKLAEKSVKEVTLKQIGSLESLLIYT